MPFDGYIFIGGVNMEYTGACSKDEELSHDTIEKGWQTVVHKHEKYQEFERTHCMSKSSQENTERINQSFKYEGTWWYQYFAGGNWRLANFWEQQQNRLTMEWKPIEET